MPTETLEAPAPSAVAPTPEPAAAPVTPAAAPVAPSAPVPMTTLEDLNRYALQAIRATEPTASPSPEAPPETPAAPESPAAPAEPEGSAAPAPVATGEDISAEEQAQLSEAGRRALVAERQKRKEAREEVQQLREELAALKAKLETPATPPEATPPANSPAPVTMPSMDQPLGDCMTLEAVDARAMQATQTLADAKRIQKVLVRQGAEQAAAELAKLGVTHIGTTPLAEATNEQIETLLDTAEANADKAKEAAPMRRQFLVNQVQSFIRARHDVPELADPKHPRAQRFAQITNANPWLRQMGPNWPELVATQLLGEEARAKAATGRKPAPVPTPPLAHEPTPRPAPAAARTVPAAAPRSTEADELAAKVKAGTASIEDFNRLGVLRANGQ